MNDPILLDDGSEDEALVVDLTSPVEHRPGSLFATLPLLIPSLLSLPALLSASPYSLLLTT